MTRISIDTASNLRIWRPMPLMAGVGFVSSAFSEPRPNSTFHSSPVQHHFRVHWAGTNACREPLDKLKNVYCAAKRQRKSCAAMPVRMDYAAMATSVLVWA
jgi:hypothetical protein